MIKNMTKNSLTAIVVAGILLTQAKAAETDGQAPKLFATKTAQVQTQEHAPVKISPQMIPICYNFGCRIKEYVSLTPDEWSSVEVLFKPQTNSAKTERIRIGKAIARMEQLAGNYTPIHKDIGYNLGKGATFPGQLDCVDESINTTTFLHVLERYDLIKHHKVIKRAYRRAAFDQHWTGQLEENGSGERYVVDTWFYDNGEMPVIQPTKEWLDISIFTSYTNNANKSQQAGEKRSLTQKVGNTFKGLFN